MYSYIADSANDVMNDRGDLWAFVSDNPAKDDYFDFAPGDTTSITGHFGRSRRTSRPGGTQTEPR